jgi:hypothetical protein
MPSSFLSLRVPPHWQTKRRRICRVLVAGKLLKRLCAGREVGDALHSVVDEHAVEVVELVLQDAGLESPRLDEDLLSPDGTTGNHDLGGPPDAGRETRQGKASLPAALGAGGQDDLGVDQQDDPVRVGGPRVRRHVDDHGAGKSADLRSGEADTARVRAHGREQVGHEGSDSGVDLRTTPGNPAQQQVGGYQDRSGDADASVMRWARLDRHP